MTVAHRARPSPSAVARAAVSPAPWRRRAASASRGLRPGDAGELGGQLDTGDVCHLPEVRACSSSSPAMARPCLSTLASSAVNPARTAAWRSCTSRGCRRADDADRSRISLTAGDRPANSAERPKDHRGSSPAAAPITRHPHPRRPLRNLQPTLHNSRRSHLTPTRVQHHRGGHRRCLCGARSVVPFAGSHGTIGPTSGGARGCMVVNKNGPPRRRAVGGVRCPIERRCRWPSWRLIIGLAVV